jgi:hypothetical protein
MSKRKNRRARQTAGDPFARQIIRLSPPHETAFSALVDMGLIEERTLVLRFLDLAGKEPWLFTRDDVADLGSIMAAAEASDHLTLALIMGVEHIRGCLEVLPPQEETPAQRAQRHRDALRALLGGRLPQPLPGTFPTPTGARADTLGGLLTTEAGDTFVETLPPEVAPHA